VLALSDHGHVLAPLLQSNTVVKLGFDTKGDVEALRSFLARDANANHVMSKLVDLQAVERDLRVAETTSGEASNDALSNSKLGLTRVEEQHSERECQVAMQQCTHKHAE
jgi:hypothetical protein